MDSSPWRRNGILDRAGLDRPGVGCHIDRHLYARDFIQLGGWSEEPQKSLGHRSMVTTEQLYGHFHEDVAAVLTRGRIYREDPNSPGALTRRSGTPIGTALRTCRRGAGFLTSGGSSRPSGPASPAGAD